MQNRLRLKLSLKDSLAESILLVTALSGQFVSSTNSIKFFMQCCFNINLLLKTWLLSMYKSSSKRLSFDEGLDDPLGNVSSYLLSS